jgi:anti-anti-sigma factor
MFTIQWGEKGEIQVAGRWSAAETGHAEEFFRSVTESRIVDFSNLEYISSAGLGVLIVAQKRLADTGGALRLVNLNHHIADVFRYSGLDRIFGIADSDKKLV